MQAHLSHGCQSCRRTAEVLGKLAATVAAEFRHQPPQEVVRRAKSLYATLNLRHGEKSRPIVARLVFYSSRDALRAGVRSAVDSRHVLDRVQDLSIDLQFVRDDGSPLVVVAGQIVDGRRPRRRLRT